MSDEKRDDSDENKDEKDPFNFFKLSMDESYKDKNKDKKPIKFPFLTMVLLTVAAFAVINMFMATKPDNTIPFSEFRKKIESGEIVYVEMGESNFVGYGPIEAATSVDETENLPIQRLPFVSERPQNRKVYQTTGVLMQDFIKLLNDNNIQYKFIIKQNNYFVQILINLIIPFGIIFLMYFFIFRKMSGGAGGIGSIFNPGASRAKAIEEGKVKTRFADVAGVDEAKEELVEVVDFLKSPKKYTDIGGKIPKGVLLVGPPGTGKTLLARAVAGEAAVPFFRISGSDFVEMFVGVGASRVRDLFKQAREKAPCIIFIDELDAIGKSRVNNLGGNDEREQTLNQLLVEMDGFDNEKGLIILAATNRPDILDPALLRPGRFDRQVAVDRPDVKGREEILRIHAKNVKLDSGVNFQSLAHNTAGFAGADLANIVNEAALLAVRSGRTRVSMADFDEAIEKTMIGLKKKSRTVRDDERKIVAFHETGHALVAAFTEGSDPVHKITIIPRGIGALGYTVQLPEDDVYLKSEKKLLSEVDVMLGGRAAEEIIFDEISTGAGNDIQRATDTIRSMITVYGMSERFKNMTLGKKGYGSEEPQLVREYSEDTQKYIDDEIARVMNERYIHVIALLREKSELLNVIANRLLEIETMDSKEFNEIINAQTHCEKLTVEARSKTESEKTNESAETNTIAQFESKKSIEENQ